MQKIQIKTNKEALTDGCAADRTGHFPIVHALIEDHVGSRSRGALLGASGKAYNDNWIRAQNKKWVLPLKEMSISLVESKGLNLKTCGRRLPNSASLPVSPALSSSLPLSSVAEVWEASASWAVMLISLESSLLSSVISCTLICDLYWFNLCNSVFECSLEVCSAL